MTAIIITLIICLTFLAMFLLNRLFEVKDREKDKSKMISKPDIIPPSQTSVQEETNNVQG